MIVLRHHVQTTHLSAIVVSTKTLNVLRALLTTNAVAGNTAPAENASPSLPTHRVTFTATVVLMSIVVPAVPGIIGALAAALAPARVVYGVIGTIMHKARELVTVERADYSGKINKSPAPPGKLAPAGSAPKQKNRST